MFRTLNYFFIAAIILTLLFSAPGAARAQTPITEASQAAIQPPTPAEIIDAINALRLSYGLPTLAVHPVLMALAQRQADGIAAGLRGHWRPYGLTLGQLLMVGETRLRCFAGTNSKPHENCLKTCQLPPVGPTLC